MARSWLRHPPSRDPGDLGVSDRHFDHKKRHFDHMDRNLRSDGRHFVANRFPERVFRGPRSRGSGMVGVVTRIWAVWRMGQNGPLLEAQNGTPFGTLFGPFWDPDITRNDISITCRSAIPGIRDGGCRNQDSGPSAKGAKEGDLGP